MTSPDWMAELQEVLWETGAEFGVRMKVSEQVAVARLIVRTRPAAVTAEHIWEAFASLDLPRPSNAYAKEVLSRIRRVQPPTSLREVLAGYRQFAIQHLSVQFGGKTGGNEESLRNNLLTYLPTHGFTEARTGRGRTDIRIPPPGDAVIEVKVWTTKQYYEDGLVELERYLHTEKPREAFMVVFGDREPLPSIVRDHRQEIAEERSLEGLLVPVFVVPFEVEAPSKAAREERRRNRDRR